MYPTTTIKTPTPRSIIWSKQESIGTATQSNITGALLGFYLEREKVCEENMSTFGMIEVFQAKHTGTTCSNVDNGGALDELIESAHAIVKLCRTEGDFTETV